MADILVVEDEKPINNLICRNLVMVGHNCTQVYDGTEALEAVFGREWDLIVLDVMLPGLTGFELMEQIKEMPVIFVTARDSLRDRLKGLTSGAEDYLVKPFEMQELIARVDIVLRRFHKNELRFELDGTSVFLDRKTVERDGRFVELTPREFELLEALIKNRNLALSRERLLNLAWGYDFDGDERTVDVHIQKLRKKLGWEERIKTVYKLGYRLDVRQGT